MNDTFAPSSSLAQRKTRVLVVDDNADIHRAIEDSLKRSTPELPDKIAKLEAALFASSETMDIPRVEAFFDFAFQGVDALGLARRAMAERRPYDLAFVDMRMPPGLDGLETIRQLWKHSPDTFAVICSAYSDHSWEQITSVLGPSHNLLILRKPFHPIEVRQIVASVGNLCQRLSTIVESLQVQTSEALRATSIAAATMLASSSPEPLLVSDWEGRIAAISPALESLAGQAAAHLIGQPLERLFLSIDGQTPHRPARDPERLERVILKRGDGTTASVELRARALPADVAWIDVKQA